MKNNETQDFFKADAVFAASNSSSGFKSYYGEVFNKIKFEIFYIIKGGPGTGKSRFMRDVAEYAERLGRYVEYYNCSSDPDSLDGIIIDGRIVLLDGTAPHVSEPDIPGARDEIINLGAFWDSSRLARSFEDIAELGRKKNESYVRGYRYLSGCGELSKINDSLVLPAIKERKMLSYIERIVSSAPRGAGFSLTPALIDSIGMKGRVRFDTYEKCAEKLYIVLDWYSTAHFFLSAVITCAQRNDIPVKVSYDPINSSLPNCVYFCNSGIAFAEAQPSEANKEDGTLINMKRFLEKDIIDGVKQKYKYNMRLYDAFVSSACDSFAEAGEYHFELEKIYLSCMDFDAKERFTRSFCEQLKGFFNYI